VPRRALDSRDVDEIVGALVTEHRERWSRTVPTAQSAQALVEAALVLPLVLAVLFGTIALSRLVQAQTAVIAVAHEAARAGALASGQDDAIRRMRQRSDLVAPGLGLDPHAMVLGWDVTGFARPDGRVTATVRYTIDWHDLPLVGWTPAPTVRAEHVEWVDPFRSGVAATEGARP
jgi:Flp pilus assembly protein TadG